MSQERSVHDIVLAIFEKHRATPGAPFELEHFIDYLVPVDPNRLRSIRNSFRGLKRFNAFIDELQLELNVFLSIRDREANYSLPKFVLRMEELMASKRSSLASLRNHKRRSFEWHAVFLFNLIVAAACTVAFRAWPPLVVVPLVGAIVINWWFVKVYLYERRYLRLITARLSEG
jgi:hypothetical protein